VEKYTCKKCKKSISFSEVPNMLKRMGKKGFIDYYKQHHACNTEMRPKNA